MAKTPIFPLPIFRRSAHYGYTLAELLVVLMILGLVTALAAPRITLRSDSSILRANTARLVTLLRTAKVSARRTGQAAKAYIDPLEKTAWIEGKDDVLQLDPKLDVNAIGAEIESLDNAIGISFFADGMSTGGEVKLGLGGIERTIEIIWATGEVRFAQSQ